MRELHAVMLPVPTTILKKQALLFDRFHIALLDDLVEVLRPDAQAEIEYLRSEHIILDSPSLNGLLEEMEPARGPHQLYEPYEGWVSYHLSPLDIIFQRTGIDAHAIDFAMRVVAGKLNDRTDIDLVPICEHNLPEQLGRRNGAAAAEISFSHNVLRIAVESLPTPDEGCAWEDILDFKAECHDHAWGFRRFLRTLATKQQTEAEIRDDIEWTLNEYTNAMRIHQLKSSPGVIEAYILPVLEVIEGFPIPKLSSLLKAKVSISKRRVELIEAELNARGRECAYIYHARKQFASIS